MPRYNLSLGNTSYTLAETDERISKQVGRKLAGSPDTLIDSGGTVNSYSFEGQEITRSDLRDIKQMRESGGVISMLVHSKALMNFGTGVEWVVEDDETPTAEIDGEELTLTEWLEDTFDDINSLVLDIGEDALWYPYGACEIVETRGGDFSHVEPVEPWTILPQTNEKGNIVYWEQEIQGRNAETRQYLPDEIIHFPINKSSARDKTGISAVLRSQEEIKQFRENQQAIASAIELHGFPQRHVKVGREGSAPIRDTELRRIRNLFDSRTVDSDTVFVTGQDVDIEALEAENFDFQTVTENDMRQLSLALGVPLELTNYGKDGLGSGKPAELRLELFKLQIKANQRNFTNIWVRDVLRPVLEEYTPFNHTRNIQMNLNDPITGDDEVANIIQKVGNYMETNEARKKLDLEPKDELEGEYGAPQDEQAQPEMDPGGDAGFFSAETTRQLQQIPDNANPISSRDECTGSVIEGPQGGLYCVPDGDESADDGAIQGDVRGGDPPESVDLSMEEESQSLEDAGIISGSNHADMRIAQLENGSEVFVRENVDEFEQDAIAAGNNIYAQVGVPLPDQHISDDGTLAKEAIDGQTLQQGVEGEVDEESVVDAYAASIITGDTDMHGGNMMVREDGTAVPIDIAGSGGVVDDVRDKEAKASHYLDELEVDVTFDEVAERAEEMAQEIDVEDIPEGMWTDNIVDNVEAIA